MAVRRNPATGPRPEPDRKNPLAAIVAEARRFGLGIPDELVRQAVRFGLASDLRALVEALLRRFTEIVPVASEQALGLLEIEAHSRALEGLATRPGTSTESDLSCTMQRSG